MNQQPPIDFSIFFAVLAVIILVVFVVQVLVIYFFLYKPATEIPEQYRHTSPGSAFLLLIPLFGVRRSRIQALIFVFIWSRRRVR